MKTSLNPYPSFIDNKRQAMEFYKSVFGGELKMNTLKEYHASDDPREGDKIMHAVLDTGNGIAFMAADTPNRMEFRPGANITMSLSGGDEGEPKTYFKKPSSGGKATMPLEKAVWGDTFGICTDKHGINWMVNLPAPKA